MFVEYQKSNRISIGSLVMLYMSPRHMYPIIVEQDGIFDHACGRFSHAEMVDKPFGYQMYSHNRKGSLFLLHPDCERWTLSLPHRTQIVYTPDITVITDMLDLHCGSRVVESGTGSASLTHSLARSVFPHGRVFTFEYHKDRVAKAKEEFQKHDLDGIVRITQRNVYTEGFTLDGNDESIEGSIDAVFLDLPEPWKAIGQAVKTLNPAKVGRICCFSPCIEQVQKTRASLVQHGFTDVVMFECLQKRWEARLIENPSLNQQTWNKDAVKKEKVMPKKRRHGSNESDEIEQNSMYAIHNPQIEGKGHTAYLTFASLLPSKYVN